MKKSLLSFLLLLAPLLANAQLLNLGGSSGGTIADGAVTTVKLAGGAVTTSKVGSGAVKSHAILDAAVTTPKLGHGSVSKEAILAGAVTTGKVKNDSITTDKILNKSITRAKLSNDGCSSGNILELSGTDWACGVATTVINDGDITTAKLANGAVDGALQGSNTGVRLGLGANNPAANATAIGIGSNATGINCTAVGKGSSCGATSCSALGDAALCSGANSNAFGENSSATGADTVVVGASSSDMGFTDVTVVANAGKAGASGQFIGGSLSTIITDVYFGRATHFSGADTYTIHGTSGTGTDNAGHDLQFAGGKGTGSADGGKITFLTSPAGTTGTGHNALIEQMRITSGGTVMIGAANLTAGPFQVQPPVTQVVAGGDTIAADACGTIKKINSVGSVTTSLTNTFTAIAATSLGCCMDIINVDGADTITLDNNAEFVTVGGVDIAVGPFDSVRVCSDGANRWYQASPLAGNS